MKLKLSRNVIINGLLAIGLLILLGVIIAYQSKGDSQQQVDTQQEQKFEVTPEIPKDRLQVESKQELNMFGQIYFVTIVKDIVTGRFYMFLANGTVSQIIPML